MKRSVRVCLFALVAALLSGCGFRSIHDLPLPGDIVGDEASFQVTAEFEDALNVVPRTSVRVGDVPVGQVEAVERVGWNARVTMRVRNDVDLPDDTEARIRQTSLLGEKFIELVPAEADSTEPGTATGRLGDGDVIPVSRTNLNPEVEDVLGALSMLLTGGGVDQLGTITQELNALMNGRTDELSSLLNRLDTFVGTIDTQRGDIIAAMESINGLSDTLADEQRTVASTLDSVGPAIDVLRDQHDELVAMLGELDRLGQVGSRVVEETKDDLIAELEHLEPVLRELANTGDSLIPGLAAAASYPFAIDAADAIHGDYANVIFSFQLNLKPVSQGGLLPTTLNDLENLCKATPTAPICSPIGDTIEQLCGLLGSLPLCRQQDDADISAMLARIDGTENAPTDVSAESPDTPTPPTTGAPTVPTVPEWLTGLLKGLGR
ncbi:MAG TPA: MCE family protein [Aeromicrobium sp.]|nr:MCE family protein [Aeromicrobium sp.]